MVVTTESRHLLIQLQTGQNSAGKPKLHNRAYPHVDVTVADDAIDGVLVALAPLFADPVYSMGRVDTVQIQSSTSTSGSGSSTGSTGTSGSGSSTGSSGSTGSTSGTGTSTSGSSTGGTTSGA